MLDNYFNLFFHLLCLVHFSVSQAPGAEAPPEPEYVLNFDSPVYVCPDDVSKSFIDTSKVDVVQYNETTAMMSGIISFNQGMDYSTMLVIEIAKEMAGNRYEVVMSHEICDLCEEISSADGNYKQYLRFFGFPDTCPFEAGEYKIHDLVADTSDLPIKKSNEGRYLITITIYKNEDGSCKDGTFLACVKLDTVIEQC